jgi:hypothetical protein
MSSTPSERDDVLEGWGEIAKYINKGVRTARNWAKRDAMPVSRNRRGNRFVVTASKTEIDRWRAERALPPGSSLKDEGGTRLADSYTRVWPAGLAFFAYGVMAMVAEVAEAEEFREYQLAILASGALTGISAVVTLSYARHAALRSDVLGLLQAFALGALSLATTWVLAASQLPWEPIVKADISTYGAKAGYLKACVYAGILLLYVLIPFHYVVASSAAGDARGSDAHGRERQIHVGPHGSVYVPLHALAIVLVVALVIAYVGISHLFDSLVPHPQKTAFQIAVWARASLWFVIAASATLLYGVAIREDGQLA